jgi:N,N'-diacetyllegionaminate synthase
VFITTRERRFLFPANGKNIRRCDLKMASDFRQICLPNSTDGARCLIIGEVAQSHDGSLGQAHAFIDAIASAGADAVKFQTHIAHAESTRAEPWRLKFSRQDDSRYAYWERMEFTAEQWAGLKEHADERGLLFLSSPFSLPAVELLDKIGMNVWKIASGEVGNTVLLKRILENRQPVILSSGLSDWSELDEAVSEIRASKTDYAVLQCTSAYPCPPEKIGLNLIEELQYRYYCPVGLSDHSGQIYASLAAVARGAEVLEVHVALSREMFGPDVAASVTTAELKQLVEGVRQIEKMLANPVDKHASAAELAELRRNFTKSIYAAEELAAGTILTGRHLILKKPGIGIPAGQMQNLIGQKLVRSLHADELVLLADIELSAFH